MIKDLPLIKIEEIKNKHADIFCEYLYFYIIHLTEYLDFKILELGKNIDISYEDLVVNLPECLKYMWFIRILDWEIGNGGFEQYYWNKGENYFNEILEGCEYFGLYESLIILKESIKIFLNDKKKYEIQKEKAQKKIEKYKVSGASLDEKKMKEWEETWGDFKAIYEGSNQGKLNKKWFNIKGRDNYETDIFYLKIESKIRENLEEILKLNNSEKIEEILKIYVVKHAGN